MTTSTDKKKKTVKPSKRKPITKKTVKKRSVSRTLSKDNQNARMEVWAQKLGLDKQVVADLNEKYGPYAYKIMSEALYPGRFHQTTGYPYYNSKQLLKKLITEDGSLTEEQLSKLTKESPETIRAEMSNHHFESKVDGNTPKDDKIEDIQAQATQQATHMDARVDEMTTPEVSAQRSELTEKQRKEMDKWARQVKLSSADMDKLIEKYGSIAYDIVHDSMYKPSVVMTNMGEKPIGSSKKTIQYFLNNDVSSDKLAKAVGKSEDEIEAEKQAAAMKEEKEKELKDKRMRAAPDHKSGKKAKNREELEEAAYKEFSKIEGNIGQIYLDCNLNPTIGVGHLCVGINNLDNKEYRRMFLELPLVDAKGNKLTRQQKEKQYDFIINELKKAKAYKKKHPKCSNKEALACTRLGAKVGPHGAWIFTNPTACMGHLNQDGIRATFNKDFATAYNQTKKYVRNLHNYSLETQLLVTWETFNRGHVPDGVKTAKTEKAVVHACRRKSGNKARNALYAKAERNSGTAIASGRSNTGRG